MPILDALTVLLPSEIYQLVIFSGIIYFVLFFYGTKQWEKYTEFDKVVFSVIFGGFVLYFFIIPITIFMFILNVFQKPEIIIQNDFPLYSYTIYFILALYLIVWRLFLANNKPLKDNNNFLKSTELLIAATILTITVMDYALLVAFYFSTYQEHLAYIIISIIFLPAFLLILYYAFLKIFPMNDYFFPNPDKLPYLNLVLENKKLWAWLILIIFVAAALIGTYFLKTTTQVMEETPDRLAIQEIFINREYGPLQGYSILRQNYTIRFGLIPWVKIKPNITLKGEFDQQFTTYPYYNFSGEYLLVKNQSWNTINVIIPGRRLENDISKNFYSLTKKDFNDTVQIWMINFSNPYPYDIEILYIIVEKDKQLKLINHDKNNLRLDGITNEPTDHQITIKNVGLPHEKIYSNQSITLFFEKNNTY